jgi:uncharacterized membrane protein YhaH (DUF805 family)
MTFSQAISSGFQNYVNFQGRASRSAFWWWALFNFLVALVLVVIQEVLGPKTAMGVMFSMIMLVVRLGLLLPSIAVTVRRLHDTGHSGWWILIAFTIIGAIYPLLFWYCTPGTAAENRYGGNPLELEPEPAPAE